MKKYVHLFNLLYNIFFRVMAFLVSFYLLSKALFCFVTYEVVKNNNNLLLIVFIIICIGSVLLSKLIVMAFLRLLR